jgi:hypothetical protein
MARSSAYAYNLLIMQKKREWQAEEFFLYFNNIPDIPVNAESGTKKINKKCKYILSKTENNLD